jgi:hypothetical protein
MCSNDLPLPGWHHKQNILVDCATNFAQQNAPQKWISKSATLKGLRDGTCSVRGLVIKTGVGGPLWKVPCCNCHLRGIKTSTVILQADILEQQFASPSPSEYIMLHIVDPVYRKCHCDTVHAPEMK